MKKASVLSVMLWVVLSLSAATYVGCKGNNSAEEPISQTADSTQVDTTVVDTAK